MTTPPPDEQPAGDGVLFAILLTQEPADRHAWIEHNVHDPGQRRRLVQRLALEPTVAGDFGRIAEGAEEIGPPLPEWIGRYRVLEILGEGGMGSVYLAEQSHPIRRRVAVKLIRSAHPDRHSAHRFEAERQALARMSHPSIAQVYEAGDTENGQPYFAMEHVPGEPITDYCDRAGLSLDARLALFVEVCQGIHHAHQKGILHRDIKPENVLVAADGERPVPKIIDFGIAKALDQPLTGASLTAHGVVVGTPSYLSPESVELQEGDGDPDIRSDVYSLGILLFELLVGSRPFGRPGDSYLKILRQVAEGEVRAPSLVWKGLDPGERQRRAEARGTSPATLGRLLRGDLDWITLRATARDRERRYGSAAELAEEIERHRRFEPVRAGPPRSLYVLGRFLRRYRAAVLGTALVVIALAAGVTARSLEAARANREAAAARQAQSETQQVVDFLVDLFEVNDPGTARGNTITARELLDRGAEKIRGQLAEQPLSRARLLDTIGLVYRRMDLPEPAAPLLEDALETRERLLGPEHPEVATSLDHLGVVQWLAGEYPASVATLQRALAIREKVYGSDHLLVADVLDHLGSAYEIQADYDAAEPILRRALAIRERRLGPGDLKVADSLDDLGVLALDRGDAATAEPLLRRTLEIRETRLGPDHPDVAVAANGLAIALYQLHRLEESVDLHARALAIREKVFGPDSAPVAQSLNNLASVDLDLGRDTEAEAALLRAAAIWGKILGPEHPRLGIVLTNLGDLHLERGEPGAAEPFYRRAATIFESGLGAEHPNLAYPLKGLADSLRELGRAAEGLPLCRRALAIREAALGPDDPETVETRQDCAGWSGGDRE